MAAALCVFCNRALPMRRIGQEFEATCTGCRRTSRNVLLPALLGLNGGGPPTLPDETPPGPGEAACFYSSTRRATKECQHCGVLMSDVWAAQWGQTTVCLKCLEHLRQKGSDLQFRESLVLWDNVALSLALVPLSLVFWFMAVISAPSAVLVSLWHWNSPRSMVTPRRWRLVLAILLGLLQIAGGVGLVLALWFKGRRA